GKTTPRETYARFLGDSVVLDGDGKSPVSSGSYEILQKLHGEKMAFQRRLADKYRSQPVDVPQEDGTIRQLPLFTAYLRMTGPIAPGDTEEAKARKEAYQKARDAYAPPPADGH
ncbi:MAG: hypothetical protein LBB14_02940, partial [Puniceicoccales bacterium]|nr:hypothetical protein [Puniceicoccales bacterium]